MDIVYEALKKIPGITDHEAHEVANKISKPGEVAALCLSILLPQNRKPL